MPSPAVSRRSGRRRSFAIAAAALAGLLLPSAAAGEVRSGALQGPPGISRSKVLVVGVDGTRWDLVRRLTDEGRLPNLRRMAGDGFAIPSMLQYAPPQAFTMSAVGWSTISSGVWPAKHGVVGLFNDDAAQAGKNGYADFLTRLERVNPAFSTFSVTDWGNLGLHHDGGPIFGDDIDVKHAVSAEDSIPAYEAADAESVRIAGDYLRTGDPDAGFVYLGLVDETGHVVGSTGPAYREAIVLADRRIGHLLRSIDARPTRAREQWTVIVTTDHGHQELPYGSLLIHGGGSDIERRSFVVATGPGVTGPRAEDSVRVTDIAPTVLHQLRVPQDPAWNLDGRSFVATPVPADPEPATDAGCLLRGTGRAARPGLVVTAGGGSASLRTVRVTLPVGASLRDGTAAVRARADGRIVRSRAARGATRRTVTVRVPADGVERLSLRIRPGHLRVGGRVATRWSSRTGPMAAVRMTDGRGDTVTRRVGVGRGTFRCGE